MSFELRHARNSKLKTQNSKLKLASMVKRTSCLASNQGFQVQILVGVLVESRRSAVGRLRDVEKIGGSIPPGTTDAVCVVIGKHACL